MNLQKNILLSQNIVGPFKRIIPNIENYIDIQETGTRRFPLPATLSMNGQSHKKRDRKRERQKYRKRERDRERERERKKKRERK